MTTIKQDAAHFRDLALRKLRLGNEDAEQFTLGIEEEYFLHDLATNKVATKTPEALFKEANAATNGRVEREFLQAQAR